jgi:AraC-like DNA-binding protein
MPHLHAQSIFASDVARITDVSCSEPASPCGLEENASANHLLFTRSGVFLKHSGASGREQTVAEPMQVLLFNEGEPYRISHPARGGDRCTTVAFPPRVIREVWRSYDPAAGRRASAGDVAPFTLSRAPLTRETLLRLQVLRRGVRDGTLDSLAAEERSLTLLSEVIRAALHAHGRLPRRSRAGTARQHRDLVERARELMASAPGASWSLAALGRRVHSSPFHLMRVFGDVAGLSVHQYLLHLRLATALDRIDGGERDLSALSLALGFSSHSHFSSAFRRVLGIRPSEVGRISAVRSTARLRAKNWAVTK